jgi:hypothetical protein
VKEPCNRWAARCLLPSPVPRSIVGTVSRLRMFSTSTIASSTTSPGAMM